MPREIDLNDEFAAALLGKAPILTPESPRAFYNVDGDCVEFYFSNESFFAERVDNLVTVFYGRDSGRIVGALLKGVSRFVREITSHAPGFAVEIEDGRVRLACVLTAGMWRLGDRVVVHTYKKLRDAAEQTDLTVDVPSLA